MIKRFLSKSSLILFLFTIFTDLYTQSNEDCLMCHEDPDLSTKKHGKVISLYVNNNILENSAHKKIECISCHKDAVGEEFPHAEQLVKLGKVNCGSCHDGFNEQVENDIHHQLKLEDKIPTCKTCHNTHAVKSMNRVKNKSKEICGKCHKQNVLTSAYHISSDINKSCTECHDQKDYRSQLSRSVHKKLSCSNCHSYVINNLEIHQESGEQIKTADCYLCHGAIAAEHKESIHGISITEGINEAAQCWNCHGSHRIYPVMSDSSMVNPKSLVATCGACHDDPEFYKKFFSVVKQPGKMYSRSVHGKLVMEGRMDAASCVTCHGIHDIKNRIQPGSKISSINLPNTCAECHKNVTEAYKQSIHWIAVKKGVRESPTCNDCHSEHSIHAINTVSKRKEIEKIQENTCLQCHNNLLLSTRYGMNKNKASSYQDSYHGLAVMRGDPDAAMCIDCHGVHKILPKFHKESTVNENNITNTCKKCHINANKVFSNSYSHLAEQDTHSGFIQGLVRKIYFWVIVIVIGSMFLHNLIIYIYDVKAKIHKIHKEIRVPRLNSNEVVQHLILIISFTILAITGFQLKFPESWWAKGLTFFMDETVRQNVHRAAAITMIALSIYHTIYLFITSRGRDILTSILPKLEDFKLAYQNIMYHLGLRKKHPEFDNFNYIEKAEYWALIWGTIVMGATGFVLWFPTIASNWAPVWFIKVCEIIHYYEAILATLAIIIWHWFFVIYRPVLRFTFLDGQMTLRYYKEEHKRKFKKILIEWFELRKGKRSEKELSNYTKMFIYTIEKQGYNIDQIIKQELDKDEELRRFINQNN